ncbi:hypothetical protein BLOT_002215 [Blomia tropicalis]|nr:hypothetical protein BLOT_002215 [Blomia tropicalis]
METDSELILRFHLLFVVQIQFCPIELSDFGCNRSYCRIWLAIACAFSNDNGQLMIGYCSDSPSNVYVLNSEHCCSALLSIYDQCESNRAARVTLH